MVYVTGVAVPFGKHIEGDSKIIRKFINNRKLSVLNIFVDAYKNIERQAPSCLLMCNPENSFAVRMEKLPTWIMDIHHIRIKKATESTFSDVRTLTKSSPFTLVDSHDKCIPITPNGDTDLYFTRIQRDQNLDLIRKILFANNLLRNNQEVSYGVESLKNVLFEGDVVTIGGFLYYNFSSDSLEIKDVNVITGGGQQNMIQYFKDWKRTHGVLFTLWASKNIIKTLNLFINFLNIW